MQLNVQNTSSSQEHHIKSRTIYLNHTEVIAVVVDRLSPLHPTQHHRPLLNQTCDVFDNVIPVASVLVSALVQTVPKFPVFTMNIVEHGG